MIFKVNEFYMSHVLQLLEFFDKHPPTDYSSQDRYDSMIYMVDSNIRWQARNYNDVSSFLSIIPFNKQA